MISPDDHIEAMRPHQRTPCSKGEEGYVGPSGLGVRGEGGSAVWTERRRGSPRLCEVEGESPGEVWRW